MELRTGQAFQIHPVIKYRVEYDNFLTYFQLKIKNLMGKLFYLLVFSNLLATTELLNVGHISSRKIWSNFLTQYMDVVSNKNSSVLKIKQKYHYKFYKKAKAVILYSTQEWTKNEQDRISPYNTDTISSRQGIGIKRK